MTWHSVLFCRWNLLNGLFKKLLMNISRSFHEFLYSPLYEKLHLMSNLWHSTKFSILLPWEAITNHNDIPLKYRKSFSDISFSVQKLQEVSSFHDLNQFIPKYSSLSGCWYHFLGVSLCYLPLSDTKKIRLRQRGDERCISYQRYFAMSRTKCRQLALEVCLQMFLHTVTVLSNKKEKNINCRELLFVLELAIASKCRACAHLCPILLVMGALSVGYFCTNIAFLTSRNKMESGSNLKFGFSV